MIFPCFNTLTTLMLVLFLTTLECRKKKFSADISFDSLISGMNKKEQEMFREELQKEVKKFHIPSHRKPKSNSGAKKRKLKPRPAKPAIPGICDPICGHQCVHGCDFRCCVPGYQSTHRIPRPPVGVALPGSCSPTCSPTCFPECSQVCCSGGSKGMFQSSLDLSTLFPPTCPPGCPEACFPFCTPACCSGRAAPQTGMYQAQALHIAPSQYAVPQQPPPTHPMFTQCGGSCPQSCAPSCLTSCCISSQQPAMTPIYMPPPPPPPLPLLPSPPAPPPPPPVPMPQSSPYVPTYQMYQGVITTDSCAGVCPDACAPSCQPSCCQNQQQMSYAPSQPMPTQMQQMLQAQQELPPPQVQSQFQQQQQQQQQPKQLPQPQPDSLNKKPSQTQEPLPGDTEDIKPQVQAPHICPLTCPDMCLPDCTDACCNSSKDSNAEIDKKSKIARQLALLRKRRHLNF